MGIKDFFLKQTKTTEENARFSRQINTCYGIIEGLRLIDENDLQIDAFLGIQFAKPPVGELRFKVIF